MKTDIHIIEVDDKIIKKSSNGNIVGRIELSYAEIEDYHLELSENHITITYIDNREKVTKINISLNRFKDLLQLFNIMLEIKNNESKKRT